MKLALLLFSCFILYATAQRAVYVGDIAVPNVDLINLFTHNNPTTPRHRFSILASTYVTDRATYDSAFMLLYPGDAKARNFTGITSRNLFSFLYWPKEVQQVPRSVFEHDAVLMSDGSTLLQKTEGSVYVSDVSDLGFPATFDVSGALIPQPIMYHSGVWFQADATFRDDLVTCRVELDGGNIRRAQLVFMEHPRDGLRGRWATSIIKDSACDGNLVHHNFRFSFLEDYDAVYAVGYYTQRLTLFWSSARTWNSPSNIEGRVLATGRQFYDISVVDLNRNGAVELLVTSVGQNNGLVEVYSIPSDFRNVAQYTQRVIASGFVSRNNGANGRTPKVARPFYPTSNTVRKPWIFVAGGDDGRAYYLRPTSEGVNDWNYELVTVVDHGINQEVSGMAAADIDGDGNTELFVASRRRGVIEVYEFVPSSEEFVKTRDLTGK